METNGRKPDLNCRTALSRPRHRCKCTKEPEKVFLMKKRNYKVYCIGTQRTLLRKIPSVDDNGAGPNFIRKSELNPDTEINTNGQLPNVVDANDDPIKMLCTTSLVVRLGRRVVKVAFIVCETLAAPMILGCDFCDRFVEGIFPRQKNSLMDDGTTVAITRPLRRNPKFAPLPPGQEYGYDHGRISPKMRVAEKIELPPESQTLVTVTSERHGVLVVQPDDALYANHLFSPTNGVVQVTPNLPFRILVANFNKFPKTLVKNQVLGTLLPHPTAIYPSRISVAEVLGLANTRIPVETCTNYGESITKTDNPSSNDQTLEFRNPRVSEENSDPAVKPKLPSVDGLDLSHVPARYQKRLREMLRKYYVMWDGTLGEIKATEHAIELFPGSMPISQPPYRAGPKQRHIEQEQIEKMLQKA